MTPPGAASVAPAAADLTPADFDRADYSAYVRAADDGEKRLELLVEGVHCGGCVQRIERALQRESGVSNARLNLTTRGPARRGRGAAWSG